jgi:hypothetical protein
VYLAKKAPDTATQIMLTLPPVLLARHDTTTSAGSLNALLRKESLLLTSPNLTSAPLKSCTCSRLCCQGNGGVHVFVKRNADAGFVFTVMSGADPNGHAVPSSMLLWATAAAKAPFIGPHLLCLLC